MCSALMQKEHADTDTFFLVDMFIKCHLFYLSYTCYGTFLPVNYKFKLANTYDCYMHK